MNHTPVTTPLQLGTPFFTCPYWHELEPYVWHLSQTNNFNYTIKNGVKFLEPCLFHLMNWYKEGTAKMGYSFLCWKRQRGPDPKDPPHKIFHPLPHKTELSLVHEEAELLFWIWLLPSKLESYWKDFWAYNIIFKQVWQLPVRQISLLSFWFRYLFWTV